MSQISLELLPKRNLIELLQNRLMETLTDTICLRRSCFCLRVINIINCQIQLIVMLFYLTAILSTSVCEDAKHW